MNVDKAKKRIAKQVKKGFNGYPQVSIEYYGHSPDLAIEVVISFVLEKDAAPQEQKFACENDVREDETIQSMIVKIIDRANANTVTQINAVSVIKLK